MKNAAILILCYLLGSIPSAYLASHWLLGRDIRNLGDGNMGAKNTFHSVNKLAGATVAGVDVLKGAHSVQIARTFGVPQEVVLLAGACAVLGHDFPVFAGFRGGQGMATMLGALAMLFPVETPVAVLTLGGALDLTRNWDLSSAAALVALVALLWATHKPLALRLYPFTLLPTIALRKLMQSRLVPAPRG